MKKECDLHRPSSQLKKKRGTEKSKEMLSNLKPLSICTIMRKCYWIAGSFEHNSSTSLGSESS
uniref:Uncharacterized protein n=1 Tax=Lotus japonicus TaxID=34305 RepID=I3SJL4_LOTJA|nr:unknown [Lotus japonicus]